MIRKLAAALVAVGTAVVTVSSPAGAVPPGTGTSGAGITVTSLCTTTLSVATTEDHPRWDYRVVSGSTVLVPVSWVGEGLLQSLHYLPATVRRHQVLTVVGADGTRLSVQASPRKCSRR